MDELVLVVLGDPVPWAGKQTNPKTGMRFVAARQSQHAGKIIDAWERSGFTGWLLGEPLILDCVFWIKRPKGHFGTGRNELRLKPGRETLRPTGRPDLSNLVKLVEDALTTHAWADDDQVVRIDAVKYFTMTRAEQPSSLIRIRPAS